MGVSPSEYGINEGPSPAHLRESVNNLKLPCEDSELAPIWRQKKTED